MSKRIKFELEEANFNIVIHALSRAKERLYDDLKMVKGDMFDAVADTYRHHISVFNEMMMQARCEAKHMIPMDELTGHFASEICPCNPRVDGDLVVHKSKDEATECKSK
jgi:hypothetical protein